MIALKLAQSFFRYDLYIHLLRKGAQLPGPRKICLALLHVAAMCGDVRAAGCLMEAGIDTRHRDGASEITAQHMAEELLQSTWRDIKNGLISQWDPVATINVVSVFISKGSVTTCAE